MGEGAVRPGCRYAGPAGRAVRGIGQRLLGAPAQDAAPDQTPDVREMAEQLSRINEQLVIKNRRAARIWKIVGISILSLLALQLILMILSVTAFTAYRVDDAYTVETNQELIEDEIP